MTLFRDRAEAAERLIADLPHEIDAGWLVLALPRGGVPIAAAIARHLGAPLDLIIVRKVGAPNNPELAVAAVTGPEPGNIVENAPLCRALGIDRAELRRLAAPKREEVAERRDLWGAGDGGPDLQGRKVLIVDDGVATGTTLLAAVRAAARAGARRIAVAVPVALGDAMDVIEDEADPVVCPIPRAPFYAVGGAYLAFPQVSDAEVSRLLTDAAETTGRPRRRLH